MPDHSVSTFTEAAMVAREIIQDVQVALESELIPFLYQQVTPGLAANTDLSPEIVNQMAREFGHSSDEAEPCPACQLVAARYSLE